MQPKNFLARIAFVLGCISFSPIDLRPAAATEAPSSSNTSTTSTTTATTASPTSNTNTTTIVTPTTNTLSSTTPTTATNQSTTASTTPPASASVSTTTTETVPSNTTSTTVQATIAVPAMNSGNNITTSAGQWTLITPITGTVTPDSIALQTTLVNGQAQSANMWGALIGLSDNIAATPQYQLNIQYNGTQYNIFASKSSSSTGTGPQGNVTITQVSNPTLWNSLETGWRTSPSGLQLTLQFQKVSGKQQPQSLMILYLAGNPVWYWFDTAPTTNISRVFVSSVNCVQTFQNPTISSVNTQTLFANTPGYFPLPTSQQVLITFQSSALPSNLCCCLYASPLDTPPTYEIDLNVKLNSTPTGSQAGTHVALIHHTSTNEIDLASQSNLPVFSSDIPTSRGLYDILLPSSDQGLNSTQNYFLLYNPDINNNTIVFGTISATGVQQPLISWQNSAWKKNNTRGADNTMSLCSISSNVNLKNITLVSSIATAPTWNGFMGLKTNGSSCTVSGLQQAVAYAPGSTNWASSNLVFPQNDLGAIQFNLNLTQPSQYFVNNYIQTARGPLSTSGITTSGNGAVVLFGTAPQGLPLYGITLDPLPSNASSTNSNAVMNASHIQICAFSLASGTAQPIGTPVILQNTSFSSTYCVVYQKTNTADAAITVYNNSNATTPLATLPIPQAATGIKYVTLSCEQAPVTYNNITVSAPTAAQTLQNNGTALATFNAALNNSLSNTASTGASTTDTTTTNTSTSNSNNEKTNLTTNTTTASQDSGVSSSNSEVSTKSTPLSTSTSNSITTTPSTQPTISTPVASVTTQLTQLPIDGRATEANGLPSLSFKWGTTALNKVINSATGFSMHCSFDLTDNVDIQGTPLPSATLAIGLAPSTVDTTVHHQFDATVPVTTNGVTSYKTVSLTGFAGAAQLFLISIVPTPNTPNSNDITITQFLPSVNGANSQWVNQTVVSRAAPDGKIHSLWLSSAQTNTTQTITIGVDSDLNTNPLYTWNTTKTPLFEQTCMSGWATTVIYKDIQIKPYTDAIPTYNWDLTKSSGNTTGTLDPKGGGYLTAKVTVNELSSRNTATFMVGFTSDPTSSVAAQDNGNKIFTGAEYNIQIQATSPGNGQPYGPAYVSIRRPTSLITPSIPAGSDSPYDGSLGEPQLIIPTPPALAFHSLAQSTTTSTPGSTPSYTTAKLWVRYTPTIPTIPATTGSPSGISRTFDVGIMDPNDTKSDINSLPPLWSWTETNVDPSRKPLQNVSLSAWGNTATINEINLVQNPQGTNITPMPNTPTTPNATNTGVENTGTPTTSTPTSAGQLILNGINTSANLPAASQWDLATQISPGTQHKFTITGGDPNAYAVFAFSQNGPYTSATMNPNAVSAHPILFTIIVSSSGIILNANGQLIASSLTGGLLPTPVPYWIQADNSCFRIGGYASDNITPLITPYIQYPDAATLASIQAATNGTTSTKGSTATAPLAINFNTATTWFCAYQGFNNALLAYSGGERLKNQVGSVNPAASILRSSMSRNAARVVSAQEIARTTGILTTSGPTSNRQAMDRYTTNTKTIALSGPIAR